MNKRLTTIETGTNLPILATARSGPANLISAITGNSGQNGPFYVIEIEVQKPLTANIGFAGAQHDIATTWRGGATQAELFIPAGERHIDYLTPVTMPKKLGGAKYSMTMDHLTEPLKVWNNGATSPFNPELADLVEFHEEFRNRTGANFGVATRWTFHGRTDEDANCPVPIPDLSGLVYATDGWKQWVVLNPDGTKQFTVKVPRISAQSVPEKGELGDPRHMKDDPLHIMYGEGSDGDRGDCRFFFDMHIGELVHAELVGRQW
jgi:hypothetical protein